MLSSIPLSTKTSQTSLRSRNKRKDDAIRRKVDNQLEKSKTLRKPISQTSLKRAKAGTVASLRPCPALTVLSTARITQVAQLMASKRADAVLVVTSLGQLCGILTDKDIAYRVVAAGLDLRDTTVESVMTPNPVYVKDFDRAADALSLMTERKFRHLPVICEIEQEEGSVVSSTEELGSSLGVTNVTGLLDLAKCVFDKIQDLERKVVEDDNIILAMEALERRGSVAAEQVETVKALHGCPDISSLLSSMHPEVDIKSSVREAARIMMECHSTAVLVVNPTEQALAGIFTTKDIVLRVMASNLDPATTSVVRVMTPKPDSCSASTSILDALKQLHAGHYLHLPVCDGQVAVGLVDVQQLTMAMLSYLINRESTEETGPMWSRFWNSTLTSFVDETESVDSSTQRLSRTPSLQIPSTPTPSVQISSPQEECTVFKIKKGKTVLYMTEKFTDYSEFTSALYAKVGFQCEFEYLDEEGDACCIKCTSDLEQAVALARRKRNGKVLLIVKGQDDLLELVQKAPIGLQITVGFAIVLISAFVLKRLF